MRHFLDCMHAMAIISSLKRSLTFKAWWSESDRLVRRLH